MHSQNWYLFFIHAVSHWNLDQTIIVKAPVCRCCVLSSGPFSDTKLGQNSCFQRPTASPRIEPGVVKRSKWSYSFFLMAGGRCWPCFIFRCGARFFLRHLSIGPQLLPFSPITFTFFPMQRSPIEPDRTNAFPHKPPTLPWRKDTSARGSIRLSQSPKGRQRFLQVLPVTTSHHIHISINTGAFKGGWEENKRHR